MILITSAIGTKRTWQRPPAMSAHQGQSGHRADGLTLPFLTGADMGAVFYQSPWTDKKAPDDAGTLQQQPA
jgi:hypothetical protein